MIKGVAARGERRKQREKENKKSKREREQTDRKREGEVGSSVAPHLDPKQRQDKMFKGDRLMELC